MNRNLTIIFIVAIIIVGGVLYAAGGKISDVNSRTNSHEQVSDGVGEVYSNDKYRFSFRYESPLELISAPDTNEETPVCDTPGTVVCANYSEEQFSEKRFVKAASWVSVIAPVHGQCAPNEKPGGGSLISEKPFDLYQYNVSGKYPGYGNKYVYLHNNQCYIIYQIVYTNPEIPEESPCVIPPNMEAAECYDDELMAVIGETEQISITFKFN